MLKLIFIEILNANLQLVLKSLFKTYQLSVKYQFLGATLYNHVLEYYGSYCMKTRIHWGKKQSLV